MIKIPLMGVEKTYHQIFPRTKILNKTNKKITKLQYKYIFCSNLSLNKEKHRKLIKERKIIKTSHETGSCVFSIII